MTAELAMNRALQRRLRVLTERLASEYAGVFSVEAVVNEYLFEYDAEAVAREVAAVGLPSEYADKLLIAA